MPSIFESLRRIATGQPVFNQDEVAKNSAPQPTQPPQSSQVPGGPKVLPTVTIIRSLCRNDGPGLECEILVRNQSQQNIRLQRMEFLGLVDELGEFLEPGDEREYTFRFATRPLDTSKNIARLFFHNAPEGDYFCADHLLEFEKLADNTYTVHAFRFQPPTRDV